MSQLLNTTKTLPNNNVKLDGAVIPRMYALRFDATLSKEAINEMLDKWNEVLAFLPGIGYFQQPSITERKLDSVSGEMKTLKVFYLQASTMFWEAFTSTDNQSSLLPAVENIVMQDESPLRVSSM